MTSPSETPFAVADCTVSTDMLGDDGPSAPPPPPWGGGGGPRMSGLGPRGPGTAAAAEGEGDGRGWQVAEEMAEARDIGIRQRPFPCRYCIADPMSSSISFATWCSVTVKLSPPPPLPPLPPCRTNLSN